MDKLIYTALSGANRALHAQQVHANNLANLDTPGFRANLEQTSAQAVAGDGYDARHLARLQSDAISTRPGTLRETGRDLDVAVAGNGYLAVRWQDGEAYTRAGAIEIDAAGALSVGGQALLGEGGPIVLPPHTSMTIGADGSIAVMTAGERTMQVVDKLRLVNGEAGELTKNEAGLIVTRGNAPLEADPGVTLRARHLEGSNVSAIEAMVATMSLNRSFEMQMKLLKASDHMNEAGNRLLGA